MLETVKTPVTNTDFYLSSGPMDRDIPGADVGSFDMEDYSPLNEAYKRDQDAVTDKLVANSVMHDDVIRSGMESGPPPIPLNCKLPCSGVFVMFLIYGNIVRYILMHFRYPVNNR